MLEQRVLDLLHRHYKLRAFSTYPTSTLPDLQLPIQNILYLFSAVFEACCSILERILKPLEEENNSEYPIGREKEKDFTNLSFMKNRSNSDPGKQMLFY